MHLLARATAFLLVVILVYFSFRSDPHFRSIDWMPDWLIRFGDQYPDFRTFVPFFCFAAILPFLARNHDPSNCKNTRTGVALLMGFLIGSECLQLTIPTRSFSWADIGWGTLGITLGIFSSCILKRKLRNLDMRI